MSLHYVIDGYNVIRSADWLCGGSLRDQRERLLLFIERHHPQGHNTVTVVYDGRADVSSPRWPGPTRVVFSPGKDADKVIKALVDGLSRPRSAVVVTDDRSIQRWVKGVGAKTMGAGAFLSAGRPHRRRKPAENLTIEEVNAINEELQDLWKLK